MSEYIQPDKVYEVNMEGVDQPLWLSAVTDRMDHFEELGAYMLKYYNPIEQRLQYVLMDPETAVAVTKYAHLPLVKRDFISQHEHESLISYQAENLEDMGFEF